MDSRSDHQTFLGISSLLQPLPEKESKLDLDLVSERNFVRLERKIIFYYYETVM